MANDAFKAYTEKALNKSTYGMHSFYLGPDLKLPIAPGKYTIKAVNRNTTVDLVQGMPLKIINDPGLTGYEFEAIIPHDIDSPLYRVAEYDGGFKSPQYFLDQFEKLKTAENKKDRVFQFMIIENQKYSMNISTLCTLEDYKIVQDAEKQDLDYIIEFTLEKFVDRQASKFRIVKKSDGTFEAMTEEKAKEYEKIQSDLQAAKDAFNAAMSQVEFAKNAAEAAAKLNGKLNPIVPAAKAIARQAGVTVVDKIPGR